jgi:hypothetical protein
MYYDGFFKDDALALLKKRINFMPLLAYAFLNHMETAYAITMLKTSIFNTSWEVQPNDYTTDQLDFYGLIIRRALMTRQFLIEIGQDATPDDTLNANLNVRDMYKKMNVKYDPTNSSKAFQFKSAQLLQFQKWLDLLWSPRQEFIKVDPATYTILD